MTIKLVIQYLESIAPPFLQESYDNAGLIVGNPEDEIKGILVSLDAIESVVEEAIKTGCNMIVAHHPIVFKGLKKITGKNYVERTIIKAIKNDIAIYAIHTNLDNILYNGVNEKIAEKIGLQKCKILAPKKLTFDNNEVGAGIIGTLPNPIEESAFLHTLKKTMETSCVKHTRLLNKPINKIAICGGAGSFLLPEAIKQEADLFITADFKYHEFFDANNQIVIADIGHFESEQFTIDLLTKLLSEKFSTFAIRSVSHSTNPVFYK